MQLAEFNAFCASLPGASHAVQWHGTHVWKVGGRMFALAGERPEFLPCFKARAADLPLMLESGDFGAAPYLARAGWVALRAQSRLGDEDLRSYLVAAHAEIVASLPRKLQSMLKDAKIP